MIEETRRPSGRIDMTAGTITGRQSVGQSPAHVRRGLFLEQLVGAHDDSVRDEIFILGVFSLLDKLMTKPFDELFGTTGSIGHADVQQPGPDVA